MIINSYKNRYASQNSGTSFKGAILNIGEHCIPELVLTTSKTIASDSLCMKNPEFEFEYLHILSSDKIAKATEMLENMVNSPNNNYKDIRATLMGFYAKNFQNLTEIFKRGIDLTEILGLSKSPSQKEHYNNEFVEMISTLIQGGTAKFTETHAPIAEKKLTFELDPFGYCSGPF